MAGWLLGQFLFHSQIVRKYAKPVDIHWLNDVGPWHSDWQLYPPAWRISTGCPPYVLQLLCYTACSYCVTTLLFWARKAIGSNSFHSYRKSSMATVAKSVHPARTDDYRYMSIRLSVLSLNFSGGTNNPAAIVSSLLCSGWYILWYCDLHLHCTLSVTLMPTPSLFNSYNACMYLQVAVAINLPVK